MKQVRAQLGNDIAIKAFREGKLPFRTAQLLPRCIGMKPRRKKQIKSWPLAFPAPASNLPLPDPPLMFSLWSRTQKNTPRRAGQGSLTSRMENLATRHCTKPASPVTSLPKLKTTFSLTTHLRPEYVTQVLALDPLGLEYLESTTIRATRRPWPTT